MFNVGDRVEFIARTPGVGTDIPIGCLGTIAATEFDTVGVKWDKYVNGHSIGGRCNYGYGWWVTERSIRPYYEDSDFDPPESVAGLFV